MKKLDDFVVFSTDSVRVSMEKIERNRHRVVVVVDEGRVIGTVSDGDLRRAFLNNVLPISPVEKIMNINCRTTTVREPKKLQKIIQKEKVTVLPVVNDVNELIDVVLADEPFISKK